MIGDGYGSEIVCNQFPCPTARSWLLNHCGDVTGESGFLTEIECVLADVVNTVQSMRRMNGIENKETCRMGIALQRRRKSGLY